MPRSHTLADALRTRARTRPLAAPHAVLPAGGGALPRTTSGKVQRHACRAGVPGAGLLEEPVHG